MGIEKLCLNLNGLERLLHSPKLRRQVVEFINFRYQMAVAGLLDDASSAYAEAKDAPVWTVRVEPGEGDLFAAKVIVIGEVEKKEVLNAGEETPESSPY